MKKIFKQIIPNKDQYLIYQAIHKKSNLTITLSILVALMSVPYISLKMVYLFTLYITIILLIRFKSIYLMKIGKTLKKILFIILYCIIINYFIKYDLIIYTVTLISSIKWVYYLKLILLTNYQSIQLKFFIKYICLNLPYYTKRIIELNTLYTLLIYNLSLFIKDEVIFKNLVRLFSEISKQPTIISNNSLFNILISKHLLEKISENITSFYIGIKIKKNISLKKLIMNLSTYYKFFLVMFLDTTYILNISMWNKNVQEKLYKSKHI